MNQIIGTHVRDLFVLAFGIFVVAQLLYGIK